MVPVGSGQKALVVCRWFAFLVLLLSAGVGWQVAVVVVVVGWSRDECCEGGGWGLLLTQRTTTDQCHSVHGHHIASHW